MGTTPSKKPQRSRKARSGNPLKLEKSTVKNLAVRSRAADDLRGGNAACMCTRSRG